MYDKYDVFLLFQSNIALNRKVLADIAIYEPRSFQVGCNSYWFVTY